MFVFQLFHPLHSVLAPCHSELWQSQGMVSVPCPAGCARMKRWLTGLCPPASEVSMPQLGASLLAWQTDSCYSAGASVLKIAMAVTAQAVAWAGPRARPQGVGRARAPKRQHPQG